METNQKNEEYTIETVCNCRIVRGPFPLSDMRKLINGFSERALLATDIADRLGATMVIGEPADLDALRKLDLPISGSRNHDVLRAQGIGLPAGVTWWLASGERGASSNAMCRRFFGVPADASPSYPLDPSDLRRCLMFLDATHSHDKVPLMADVSPVWECIVESWDEIVESYRKEEAASDNLGKSHGWSAPETYTLLQNAIGGKPGSSLRLCG